MFQVTTLIGFLHPYRTPVTVGWYFLDLQIEADLGTVGLGSQTDVFDTTGNRCNKVVLRR